MQRVICEWIFVYVNVSYSIAIIVNLLVFSRAFKLSSYVSLKELLQSKLQLTAVIKSDHHSAQVALLVKKTTLSFPDAF